jgi:hypothetical protein
VEEPVPLSQIEATLRAKRLTTRPVGPEPAQRGRPPAKREQVLAMIRKMAAQDCGGKWDGPAAWPPIFDALCSAGFAESTIRGTLRWSKIKPTPRGRPTHIYPPGMEPAPPSSDPLVPAEQVAVVEQGAERLAEGLGVPVADVVPPEDDGGGPTAEEVTRALSRTVKMEDVLQQMFPADGSGPYRPELLAQRIGLVSGLRPSTRETLVGHGVSTVGDALSKGPWLDELVGSQQAERLRRYGRGE